MLGRMRLGPESLRQASWKKCGGSQGLSGSECRSDTFRCPWDQMKKRTCIKLTVFNILSGDYVFPTLLASKHLFQKMVVDGGWFLFCKHPCQRKENLVTFYQHPNFSLKL